MEMQIIHSENTICTCCMEKHEVKTVLMKEHTTFKNTAVEHDAVYFYCDAADELYMDEQQMRENDIRLKDAYRRQNNLLTSEQIMDIRSKYDITQSDLCSVLGWGGKTVTRYESHQVQDRAHDMILKKVDQDPEWFLELLKGSDSELQNEAYERYFKAASMLYERQQDCI